MTTPERHGRRRAPRRASRVATLATCALAALAVPGAARARQPDGPPSSSSSTEHETALKTGLDEYGRGNYVAAIATWESLLATIGEERGYKVLYNLGLSYQQIGDVTHAIERYRSFVKQVAVRPYADRDLVHRSEDAAKRISDLESSHGAVFVKPPARGGVVLTRVGTAEPRAAGYVVWLAPGTHSVELFVGTRHAKTVRVEIVRGATVPIDTTPPAEPLAPAGPSPAAREGSGSGAGGQASSTASGGSSGRTTWLVVGSVVTAASFALPLGLLAVAGGKKDDAEALGTGHTGYADARSSYESARTAYYVSYALPAALGLTTAIVWLTWPSATSAPPSPSVGVAVGPTGAFVRGTF